MSKTTLSLFAALALNLVACEAPESVTPVPSPSFVDESDFNKRRTPSSAAVDGGVSGSGYCQVTTVTGDGGVVPMLTGKCQITSPSCGGLHDSTLCASQSLSGHTLKPYCMQTVDLDVPCN